LRKDQEVAVLCPDVSLKVAVMQPYFFPYLSYWQLVQAVDTFVIFDDVSYINKGYVDRNNILIDGQSFSMKLELQGASQNKRINEIKVGGNRIKLLKTIERAYKRAPNFDEALPVISEILMNTEENLANFLGFSISTIAAYLNIETKIIYSSELKLTQTGKERIIPIVQDLGSKIYINLEGGRDLYQHSMFDAEHIELRFLITDWQSLSSAGVSKNSIVDVLMHFKKSEVQGYCKLDYQLEY
jgi:hypothetical protein